jgi:hypothetical protein
MVENPLTERVYLHLESLLKAGFDIQDVDGRYFEEILPTTSLAGRGHSIR